MMNWETIELVDRLSPKPPGQGTWLRTDRSKVIGGWLVRTLIVQREVFPASDASEDIESNASVAMAFVPDPTWSWRP